VAHGATRATSDLDICPAWDRDNLGSLADALQSLGAIDKGLRIPVDAKMIYNREVTNQTSPFGDVDVLLGIPEKSQYERAQYRALAADALVIEVGKDSVLIASLAAVIRSKGIADRPKDHEGLPELRALELAQRQGTLTRAEARPLTPDQAGDHGPSDSNR